MDYSEKTLKVVRFEDFTFDKESGELGKHGQRVHLRPLALRLLTILLDNAGSTVKREQLRDALWGSKVVEWEMGLHRIAKEVRSALGDNARKPRFIETVPRNGYRFCAALDADVIGGTEQSKLARTRWFLAGVFAVPGAVLTVCLAIGMAG